QFRREFIADVSHELKTPVFSAQGFIHTLLEGAIHDEKVSEKFLVKAAKNLDRLDALVNDLVSLSQLESGETTMDLEKVNLSEMVSDIFDRLERMARDREITFKMKTNKRNTVQVIADPHRIDQVRLNLIRNPAQYNIE